MHRQNNIHHSSSSHPPAASKNHSPTQPQLSPLNAPPPQQQHALWDDFLNRPNHKAHLVRPPANGGGRRIDGKQHVEPLSVVGTSIGGTTTTSRQPAQSSFSQNTSPIIKKIQPLPDITPVSPDKNLMSPRSHSEMTEIIHGPLDLKGRKLIFVLGGPGSGKGTNCTQLSAEFQLAHLSAGDLLRAEVQNGSKDLEKIMAEGRLVPMSITINLLRKGILACDAGSRGILIDGFPRELDQAIAFETATGCTPDMVLFFHCPLDILEQRLLKRGESSGRADDNLESIKKRFYTFHTQSVPVVDHYRTQSKVVEISAVFPIGTVYAITRNSVLDRCSGWRPKPGVDMRDRPMIFVLGGPGSGKGTMCSKIKELYTLAHLSVGDLLRAEVSSGSSVGTAINDAMREGKIVSLDITLDLVKRAVESVDDTYCGFLIDGFPREINQAVEWERRICTPDLILFYECPLATLEKRLLERGLTSGRPDDNLESIQKRFNTFQTQSMPVVEYYKAIHKVAWISSDAPISKVLETTRGHIDTTPWTTLGKSSLQALAFNNVVFVLGGPGCGKGTQSDKLVENLGYLHLSTGDLLRAEVTDQSPIGKQVDAIMKEGGMVPIDVIRTLLLNAMRKKPNSPGYLVDGYPRTLEQAEDIVMIIPPRFVLYFECPPETLVERLLKRGESSGRADDNLESIKKRIDVFHSTTMPVIDMMDKRGVLRKIDATRSMEEITVDTLAVFSS